MSVFATLVEQLAELLRPLFHGCAAAAAIVLFTALVRLLVHPLSRAAARGQRAREALRPRVAELRRRHRRDPERLRRALLELHAEENVSPLSGVLPSLLQLPAFFVLYRLFSGAAGGGDRLLEHRLFGAPLGGRWTDLLAGGQVLGARGAVYAVLFAVTAAVAAVAFLRARRTAAGAGARAAGRAPGGDAEAPGAAALGRVAPYLPFLTLVTVAVVPLAAALYVVTSTAWSAAERALLHRRPPLPSST
ncbi:membrane protein insertase YidC [Streptomyces tropicalis]|uniref:Membrane protein insertase YidC n=1 Tax=Streptomyces tropicalis TaxID=3034234 RepID=A0ABT5ZZ84_9ACTN|nr:membrane protein insertase YidC [Streptomyces tropicalis]MDF3297702.1 membrane protein insertase YidC [Streptomyces tropicalis]